MTCGWATKELNELRGILLNTRVFFFAGRPLTYFTSLWGGTMDLAQLDGREKETK